MEHPEKYEEILEFCKKDHSEIHCPCLSNALEGCLGEEKRRLRKLLNW